jgi:TPR repeat protein
MAWSRPMQLWLVYKQDGAVQQDLEMAVHYYRLAADQKHANDHGIGLKMIWH